VNLEVVVKIPLLNSLFMEYLEEYLFNKVTVILLCALFMGLAYFMINFEYMVEYGTASILSLTIITLPCILALYRQIGGRKTLLTVLGFGIISIIVEASAVLTGFPYGHFNYSSRLGFLLFGLVPPSLALGYIPILIGSITVASQLEPVNRLRFACLGTIFNMLVDMVVDPASVSNGFWAWETPGAYYGVPLVNFLGWLLTGFVYINIFYQIAGDRLPLNSKTSISLILVLSVWSSYLIQKSLLFPGVLGVLLLFLLVLRY
jgi:putative membrane protein